MSDIQDKEKIITNSYDAFADKVNNIEQEILAKVLDFIQKNANSTPSKMTLSKINKAIKIIVTPQRFRNPVISFLKNFDQVEQISKKIIAAENNIDLSDFDVTPEKELIVENITRGLLDDTMLDQNIRQPLKRIMYRYATQGIKLQQAEAEIKNTAAGQTERYVKTLAIESLSRFDGAINQKVTDAYGLDGFRIVGSLIKTSQEQCVEMVERSGRLGKFAVNGKYAVADLPEIIEILKKSYPGVNEELTPANYFELRNHWGCRHQFIPTRLLARDREELARRKGNLTPEPASQQPPKSQYTQDQIERAKEKYNNFLKIHTLSDYDVATIGKVEANNRKDYHNSIVEKINSGDKELAAQWKRHFLNSEVEKDQKIAATKNKLATNKAASADVLGQVKAAGKKLADYYEFVKNDKRFAKEFYSKKFTQESVNAFLNR